MKIFYENMIFYQKSNKLWCFWNIFTSVKIEKWDVFRFGNILSFFFLEHLSYRVFLVKNTMFMQNYTH